MHIPLSAFPALFVETHTKKRNALVATARVKKLEVILSTISLKTTFSSSVNLVSCNSKIFTEISHLSTYYFFRLWLPSFLTWTTCPSVVSSLQCSRKVLLNRNGKGFPYYLILNSKLPVPQQSPHGIPLSPTLSHFFLFQNTNSSHIVSLILSLFLH